MKGIIQYELFKDWGHLRILTTSYIICYIITKNKESCISNRIFEKQHLGIFYLFAYLYFCFCVCVYVCVLSREKQASRLSSSGSRGHRPTIPNFMLFVSISLLHLLLLGDAFLLLYKENRNQPEESPHQSPRLHPHPSLSLQSSLWFKVYIQFVQGWAIYMWLIPFYFLRHQVSTFFFPVPIFYGSFLWTQTHVQNFKTILKRWS